MIEPLTTKKPRRRGLADMDFGEGLARLIQTKPEEVKPPAGQKRKKVKAKVRSSEKMAQAQKGGAN